MSKKHIFLFVFASGIIINYKYQVLAVNFNSIDEQANLRVMTFNVDFLKEVDESDEKIHLLLKEIRDINPDVLCLQGFSRENFDLFADCLDSIFGYNDIGGNEKTWNRYVLYSKKPLRSFKHYYCVGDIDTIGFDRINSKEVCDITCQMPLFSAEIEVEPELWGTVFSCHLRSSTYSTARREMDEDASWYEGILQYYRNY